MLELAHHLHPNCVRELRATRLGDALGELVTVLAKWGKAADWTRFGTLLHGRVQDASWLLGEGVAMPHARAPGLATLHLAVGRSQTGLGGLPDPAERVHLIFLVAIGQEQAHYLRVASRLAWLVRDEGLRQQLVTAPTPEALYLQLREF